jgi:type IV pilus assembly protein PilV
MSALSRRDRGFTMLEVLISIVVVAFGMLALARGLARGTAAEFEAVQRTQAINLASNMADRIALNRKQAASYVDSYAPTGAIQDCTGAATTLDRDKCEWNNKLRGENATSGVKLIGAPIAAQGCVEVGTAPNTYVVTVAWQGIESTAAPNSDCGSGAFDAEERRRTYSTLVQVAILSNPPPPGP